MLKKVLVVALISAFSTPAVFAQTSSSLPSLNLGTSSSTPGTAVYPQGMTDSEMKRYKEMTRYNEMERQRVLAEKQKEDSKRALPTLNLGQPSSTQNNLNSRTTSEIDFAKQKEMEHQRVLAERQKEDLRRSLLSNTQGNSDFAKQKEMEYQRVLADRQKEEARRSLPTFVKDQSNTTPTYKQTPIVSYLQNPDIPKKPNPDTRLYEQQKSTLSMEINHATDPAVKQKLQTELNQLQNPYTSGYERQVQPKPLVAVNNANTGSAQQNPYTSTSGYAPQVQPKQLVVVNNANTVSSQQNPYTSSSGFERQVQPQIVNNSNTGYTPHNPYASASGYERQVQPQPVVTVNNSNTGYAQQNPYTPTSGYERQVQQPLVSVNQMNSGSQQSPSLVNQYQPSTVALYDHQKATLTMEMNRATDPATKQRLQQELNQLRIRYFGN